MTTVDVDDVALAGRLESYVRRYGWAGHSDDTGLGVIVSLSIGGVIWDVTAPKNWREVSLRGHLHRTLPGRAPPIQDACFAAANEYARRLRWRSTP